MLLYASKYHDIHTVINLSGRYDMKGGIEDRLGKNSLERIKQDGYIDVKNTIGKIYFVSNIFSYSSARLLVWIMAIG